ncbi:hypothetical protein [Bacillus sp. JJ1562]|uniref:hypothetical protein n=1 Tax=Bacillus sp. JJ1562 TaxID=3122960 RepID=UPI00300129CA
MNWIWLFCLLLNVLIGYKSFLTLRKRRQNFSDRFAMIIAMSSSMILSLVIGMIFSFLIPFTLPTISFFAIISGGITGVIFGAMIKFHSILVGFFGGTSGGLMGAMIGAVVQDPSLCGLPSDSAMNIVNNMLTFSIFGTILVLVCFGLLTYSLKV